jgi:hypothetical protein
MFIMSKFTVKTANADAESVIEEFLDAVESINIERFLNVWDGNPQALRAKPPRRKIIKHHPQGINIGCV